MSGEKSFRQLVGSGFRAFRLRRLREAAVLGGGVLLPVLIAGIGLGMALRYHPLGGWLPPILALAAAAAGLGTAWRFGARHRLTYPQFLRHLERRLGLSENELVNAAEMEQRAEGMDDSLSRGLAELTVRQGHSALSGISLPALAPALELKRPLLWGGASLVAAAGLYLLVPSAFLGSAGRLLRPGTYDLPPALAIQISPGNVTVDRGTVVRVRALLLRKDVSEPRLLRRAHQVNLIALDDPAGKIPRLVGLQLIRGKRFDLPQQVRLHPA